MPIIFLSASMRDITAEPVQSPRAGPAACTAGPGPASSWQAAWAMTTRSGPQETHRMTHRIGLAHLRGAFSCKVLPAPRYCETDPIGALDDHAIPFSRSDTGPLLGGRDRLGIRRGGRRPPPAGGPGG